MIFCILSFLPCLIFQFATSMPAGYLQDNCTGPVNLESVFPQPDGFAVAPGTVEDIHYTYATFLSIQWVVPLRGGILQVPCFNHLAAVY